MGDEIPLMQEGVREWVQQTARRGKSGLRTASPTVLLSLLCASAFGPLLMVGGVVGAGIAVLSSVGGGALTQVVSDALNRKHSAHSHVVIGSVCLAGVTWSMPVPGVARACRA
jgi:hypothetical protein